MARAISSLRLVQWAMLGSIVLYGLVGQLARPSNRMLDPSVAYLFATLSVAVIGIIFVVRRTLVFRASTTLATQPDDPLSLGVWRTGYIVTYALCEALALFGLLLRFLGGNLQQAMPYYIGGFILLFFFRPQQPEAEATT
ncbi:MAG TPA: hypothetical protein VGS27_21605 [Candidatus Sulfotelmatobacter sp.]|nr:hypothetical protein [Candidatus Sulfotelmatobacter sp.]